MHKDDMTYKDKKNDRKNPWHCISCLSICQERKKENSPNIPDNKMNIQKYTYEQCKIQGRSTSRIKKKTEKLYKNAESWGGEDISYIHVP